MCLPAGVLAVGALVSSAAGTAVSAYGAAKNASAAKKQAAADAAFQAQRAGLAREDALRIEELGEVNANFTLGVAGINANLTAFMAEQNIGMVNATTDFNIGISRATTDFNVSSAEGAAAILFERGQLEAEARRSNARYLELQAQDVTEAGNQAITQSRTQYAVLKGQQRARLAANGVTLDEGSSLRIQADTDYASDVDADVIRTNAIKAALGLRVQSIGEMFAADMASLDGEAAAMEKRGQALAERIRGMSEIAGLELNRGAQIADTRMTASMQILQTMLTAEIDARNIRQDAASGAWARRAEADGYTFQSQQSTRTANSISPFLSGATSLVKGAAGLSNMAYGFKKAGAI